MEKNQIKDLSRQFSDVERDQIKAFCDVLGFKTEYGKHKITKKENVKLTNGFYQVEITVAQTFKRRILNVTERTPSGLDAFICDNVSDLDKYLKSFNR